LLRRLAALFPLGRYEVEGDSMAPVLHHGERVLVNRAAYWLRGPRTGDVVVLRDPRAPHRLLIKRIESSADGGYRVLGDNADTSTDSRVFGPVTRDQIVGKVLSRY
jgi:nickel-type superoxide dismutase maturation protease